MRRALLACTGLALAIIAACSDDFDGTEPPTPANDGGTSGSSGASASDGGGDGDAPCTPFQAVGDCLVNVCNPDGTTSSKTDDTDVPAVGTCGASKCESGKPVVVFTTDAGAACNGGLCDGKGACDAKLGGACAANAECPTGFCVDGVCCVEACTGECKACNIEGSKGLCTNLAFYKEDPSYESSPGVKTNCTTALGGARCNGAGRCLKTQGTTCTTGDVCIGNKCSATSECVGAPGETCDADSDCVSNKCSMGTCN